MKLVTCHVPRAECHGRRAECDVQTSICAVSLSASTQHPEHRTWHVAPGTRHVAHPVKTDKLYLVGFMGAGKTTLAHALGKRLAWRVVDIDDLIETREGCTIAEIFKRHGEPHFRSVERQVLRTLLPLRHLVVATGGGTFADPDNRELINADGGSIWLDVPLAMVIERLPPDGRRPLASDRGDMERLYAQRQVAYQHAHLRLDAARTPIGELVERILDWLGQG